MDSDSLRVNLIVNTGGIRIVKVVNPFTRRGFIQFGMI